MPPLLGNFDHVLQYSLTYKDETGRIVQNAVLVDTQTAGEYRRVDETIGVIADQLVDWTATIAKLKILLITSDGPLTLETNDGTTPTNTFTIDTDTPLVWSAGSQLANPLTADVTALYVTNAGTSSNLRILSLEDPT